MNIQELRILQEWFYDEILCHKPSECKLCMPLEKAFKRLIIRLRDNQRVKDVQVKGGVGNGR